MYQNIDASSTMQSPLKSRDRNSCSTNVSEDSNEVQDRISCLQFELKNLNQHVQMYFQPQISQPEVNLKLHKKAIYALFSICWDRNIEEDCLWTALMIYYSYKSKKVIRKIELQKIVSVCILISCKLLKPEKFSVQNILEITNRKHSSKAISEAESQILTTLDFDICIQNFISNIAFSDRIEQCQKEEFLCLSQLLMTKNSDIFWKKSLSNTLIKFVKGIMSEGFADLRNSICQISKTKQGEIILRKYSSKLDTQKLMDKLQKF